ncbi:MAG: cation-translocating P-type ATPase [Lachnospiraceae bacterium]|nr:cation-translocating P-type ATPase [Lachnospiraceae bacterium]
MFEQRSIEETIRNLKTDAGQGLTKSEAVRRLQENGANVIQGGRRKTPVESFLEQLNDPLIYVLLAAAVVSITLQEYSDAMIIGVVVLVNALVGMIQEGKARRALEALKKLSSPRAVVLRGGVKAEISASELVPGDVVCLEAGGMVPADMRLVESAGLKIEESALTGEAVPVEKDAGYLIKFRFGESEVPLGDRRNMAYMSTMVTYGRGTGIVTCTGMKTEIGKIAAQIMGEKEELTPLQKRLGELGKVLSILSLGLCVALFGIAFLQRRNLLEMLITAISLAVAAVPEGLPAVVTICLALSVTKMVKVNTIIRRLPSVETLGAVSVVCSDKTGTLTQNRMTVVAGWADGKLLRDKERAVSDFFYQAMVLCNDATLSGESRVGDPTELALLEYAQKFGYEKERLEWQMPRISELSFDSDRKMMTTCHRAERNGISVSFTKGAPDEVLQKCTYIAWNGSVIRLSEAQKSRAMQTVEEMSRAALRTLAIAMRKDVNGPSEEQLVLLGIVGMKDPARPEAAEAVKTFKHAGVETVMITGDHVETAYAIGKQLGIVRDETQCMTGVELSALSEEELTKRLEHTRVFARVSPAQKVRIVKGFKRRGEIVAMTGDGVNDAPSLKAADIGIAMGLTGTDVAKQASDMILTDDNFATIEKAIEEGRGVYENIRKSVIFLLSSNLGEIMTMFVAVTCGLASPLKSSHILWINLITDSLPALALGVDANDGESLMQNTPRGSEESLFARGGLACTVFYGILIACISLAAFLLLPMSILRAERIPVTLVSIAEILTRETVLAKAQTYAFTVLGMSQLYHAVGMRDVQKSVLCSKPWENWLMLVACVLGLGLQVAVTEVPFLIQAFGTSHLTGREWIHLSILSACPLLAHECIVITGKLFHKKLFPIREKNGKIENRRVRTDEVLYP